MATETASGEVSNVAARIAARIERAFHQEEVHGLRLAARARTAAMIVIATWLFVLLHNFAWYYMPFLIVFVLSGFAAYGLAKSPYGRAWQVYVLHAFDAALLTFVLLVPNPFLIESIEHPWPYATEFRFGNFLWYFVLVALASLGSFSPRVLLWVGVVSVIAWSMGAWWIGSFPETVTDIPPISDSRARLERFLDPNYLSIDLRIQEGVAMTIVASILAITTWRSRKMAAREIMASRGRTNLARYFPPNMVDQLAEADNPFGEVRSQSVAVLFADIVGFTQMAEQVSPQEIVEMLRAYHRRTERLVFENNGTLDKFLGDGVMATFGNPTEGAYDAGDALACARALIAEADDWNKRREASGFPVVRLSVGVHFGPVVRGDIGTERRLEYAVLGDTVNVTSRLEELTRDLHCAIAISDELVAKIRDSGDPRTDELLIGFVKGEPQRLRGREALTKFWTFGSDAQT